VQGRFSTCVESNLSEHGKGSVLYLIDIYFINMHVQGAAGQGRKHIDSNYGTGSVLKCVR
jgi:hypothetical protein